MLSLVSRSLVLSFVKLYIIFQHPQHHEIRAFSPKYEILKNFHCTVSSSHFVRNPSKMAENPEDLNLPTAVVKRIVSDAVPPTCKVSKEANAAIAKAASVFVLYATSCANNVAQKSHRKTLTGADVIKAIHEMEFDKFVKPLEASLESWKVRIAMIRLLW